MTTLQRLKLLLGSLFLCFVDQGKELLLHAYCNSVTSHWGMGNWGKTQMSSLSCCQHNFLLTTLWNITNQENFRLPSRELAIPDLSFILSNCLNEHILNALAHFILFFIIKERLMVWDRCLIKYTVVLVHLRFYLIWNWCIKQSFGPWLCQVCIMLDFFLC